MSQRKQNKFNLLVSAIAATILGSFAAPVQAQNTLANEFQFERDTVIEFEFKESHGAYRSTLGVINLETNESTPLFVETKDYDSAGTGQAQPSDPGRNNTGTPVDFVGTVDGGTVQNRLSEYTFKANTRYAFYLEAVSPTGQTRRNLVSTNLPSQFDGNLDSGTRGDVTGIRIGFEDGGLPKPGNDADYDDFVVEAGGFTASCPRVK